jgi:hypothetical protein
VRTVRRECLDLLLVGSRRQLEPVLCRYVCHYNHARPHRGLHLAVPKPYTTLDRIGEIVRHDVLGGIIHEHDALLDLDALAPVLAGSRCTWPSHVRRHRDQSGSVLRHLRRRGKSQAYFSRTSYQNCARIDFSDPSRIPSRPGRQDLGDGLFHG